MRALWASLCRRIHPGTGGASVELACECVLIVSLSVRPLLAGTPSGHRRPSFFWLAVNSVDRKSPPRESPAEFELQGVLVSACVRSCASMRGMARGGEGPRW